MSLGPQWCLGVLFGCFYLGKRLALGRGHFGTDLGSPLWRGPAATGSGGGKTSGDATHGSHGRFVAWILVSYRTLMNILVALSAVF